MDNFELRKEFDKVERLIAINTERGADIKRLLKEKARLLKISYGKLSDSVQSGNLKKVAPIFAKELAYLNNIKKIETDLNESTEETDKEIEKIHESMRAEGLGWLLDNKPEKQE